MDLVIITLLSWFNILAYTLFFQKKNAMKQVWDEEIIVTVQTGLGAMADEFVSENWHEASNPATEVDTTTNLVFLCKYNTCMFALLIR